MVETSPSSLAPDLDGMICFSVYRAERAFSRVYRVALEPLGLTYPQYLVMQLLWRHGALSVGDITHRLGLDTGTVTPMLKRLVTLGLLVKLRRSDDERRVDIALTAEGKAMEARLGAVMDCLGEALAMDEASLGDLRSAIAAMTRRLDSWQRDSGQRDSGQRDSGLAGEKETA